MTNYKVLQSAITILKQNGISQKNLCQIIKEKGAGISEATISNVRRDKPVGPLKVRAAKIICLALLEEEYSIFHDAETYDFYTKIGNKRQLLPAFKSEENNKNSITSSVGRWEPAEKASFFRTANKEIIEIGVRLNSLNYYLNNRKKEVFKDTIENALENGVNYSCFLLDPKAESTKIWFKDRALHSNTEGDEDADKMITEIIKSLSRTKKRLNLLRKGKFKLFSYNCFPFANIIAIDRKSRNGKLLVSPYLYGINRKESPGFLILKSENKELFQLYNDSIDAILSRSIEIA